MTVQSSHALGLWLEDKIDPLNAGRVGLTVDAVSDLVVARSTGCDEDVVDIELDEEPLTVQSSHSLTL